jgi:hypothetical protein
MNVGYYSVEYCVSAVARLSLGLFDARTGRYQPRQTEYQDCESVHGAIIALLDAAGSRMSLTRLIAAFPLSDGGAGLFVNFLEAPDTDGVAQA